MTIRSYRMGAGPRNVRTRAVEQKADRFAESIWRHCVVAGDMVRSQFLLSKRVRCRSIVPLRKDLAAAQVLMSGAGRRYPERHCQAHLVSHHGSRRLDVRAVAAAHAMTSP